MKKQLAVLSVGVALAMSAGATPSLTIGNSAGSAGGGEFAVTASTDFGSFTSFCLEHDENINLGGTYYYAVNSAAVDGGNGGPSPDPISVGTSWLYNQFATGSLAANWGYSKSQENDLQEAIWWLEEEIQGVNNSWVTLAKTQLGNLSDAQVRLDAAYGENQVYVLNLSATPDMNSRNQDILVRVPDGGLMMGMLGAGLLAVGAVRRRLA